MRRLVLSIAIVAVTALPSMAAPGDQWILGIDHIDNQAVFTQYSGEGYSGPQSSGYPQFTGSSWYHSGFDGVARVWWKLSGNAIVDGQAVGNPVPTTTELYKIDFFGTAANGSDDWQPIESSFEGLSETYPTDPNIPWVGAYGTNHQWIGAGTKTSGDWTVTGPGPHTPDINASTPTSNYYSAGPFGQYMWLTANSMLYAKWNFGFSIGKSWTAIRLTQVTPFPAGPVDGDYNGDGVVDAADYVIWRKTESDLFLGPGQPADGNGDGYVDDLDYDYWRQRFGNSNAGAGSSLSSQVAVPEPATISLIAMGGLALCIFVSSSRMRANSCSYSYD